MQEHDLPHYRTVPDFINGKQIAKTCAQKKQTQT